MKERSATNQSIKEGDLVMVVRGHACDLGVTFIMGKPRSWPLGWECATCRAETFGPYVGVHAGRGNWPDVTWLKKIPPLAEPEGEQRKEEIPA